MRYIPAVPRQAARKEDGAAVKNRITGVCLQKELQELPFQGKSTDRLCQRGGRSGEVTTSIPVIFMRHEDQEKGKLRVFELSRFYEEDKGSSAPQGKRENSEQTNTVPASSSGSQKIYRYCGVVSTIFSVSPRKTGTEKEDAGATGGDFIFPLRTEMVDAVTAFWWQ